MINKKRVACPHCRKKVMLKYKQKVEKRQDHFYVLIKDFELIKTNDKYY